MLAAFFDGAEGFLDGHDVWRVRWQEQESCSGFGDEFFGALRFVEGRVVHHHHIVWREHRAEHFLKPLIKDGSVAGAVKQHRRDEFFLDQRRDQAGARATIAGA